jgi:hypothetical protein
MPTFKLGLIRQKRDDRDVTFKIPGRVLASLPSSLDISSRMGPQLDQMSLGACGPNTAAESIDCDEIAENISPLVPPSRLFIYYATRDIMGTTDQDSGVDNRSMLKALATYGYCPESMWPYADDATTFTTKPSAACYQAALANRITNYLAVPVVLDQMKASIYLGHSVIFGFEVFQQIMSSQAAQTGVLTTPASTDNSIGGHDVSLVGWDDSTQMFKFRNHWMNGPGQPWGDNGYGYIPYAYATSANWVSDLWVINAVPGGVSPPTGISTLTLITPAAIGNYPFAAGNLSLGQILAAQAYTVAFAPGTGPNTLTLTLPVPAGVYALPGLGSLDLKQTLQAVTYSVVFTPAIIPPPPPPPPASTAKEIFGPISTSSVIHKGHKVQFTAPVDIPVAKDYFWGEGSLPRLAEATQDATPIEATEVQDSAKP